MDQRSLVFSVSGSDRMVREIEFTRRGEAVAKVWRKGRNIATLTSKELELCYNKVAEVIRLEANKIK